jgi:ADP-ribose pyrophosphatase
MNQRGKKAIIVEGKFIRFVQKGEWEYAERINCTDIVIILAMTDDKKVILIEQFRPPVDKNVIEFPAGLVNDREGHKKESLFMAAKRELFEETGYGAKRIVKIMVGPVSAGFTPDTVTIVRALGLEKKGGGGGDEFENITIHEIPLSSVDAWLKRKEKEGCLVEPKVYAGLYFLKKR